MKKIVILAKIPLLPFKFMDVIKSYQYTLDCIKTANKGR